MNNENMFEEAVRKVIDVTNKNPSSVYYKKSQEATTLLERSVYHTISKAFYRLEENVFDTIRHIEYEKGIVLAKAKEAKNVNEKEFYEKSVELYQQELEKIYSGEL